MRLIITVLCGVGLYASLFMLGKTQKAERGALEAPSVVESPRARLLGRIPNAAFGASYYPLLAAGVWIVHRAWQFDCLIIAALLAAGMSAILAYSLLFVTRMPCTYCWLSHVSNACLLVCALLLRFGV